MGPASATKPVRIWPVWGAFLGSGVARSANRRSSYAICARSGGGRCAVVAGPDNPFSSGAEGVLERLADGAPFDVQLIDRSRVVHRDGRREEPHRFEAD